MESEAYNPPSELLPLLRDAAKLPKEPRLQWQLTCARLRVWVSDANETPIRPFLLILTELYPRGVVLRTTTPFSSPSPTNPTPTDHTQKPSYTQLLSLALHQITSPVPTNDNPSDTFVSPTRPAKIYVSDQSPSILNPLSSIFNKLGIECSYLAASDDLREYVKKYSNKLIERDLATLGDASNQLGLHLHDATVSESMAIELLTVLFDLYVYSPWKLTVSRDIGGVYGKNLSDQVTRTECFLERHAFKIEYHGNSVVDSKLAQFVTVLGATDAGSRGFVGGNSLRAMRRKYDQAVSISKDDENEEGDGPSAATKVLLDDERAASDAFVRCAGCGKEHLAGANAYRCSGCRCVMYCDGECQKKDWMEAHFKECSEFKNQLSSGQGVNVMRACWRRRELVVLFTDETSVPFDDLDLMETHEIPPILEESEDGSGVERRFVVPFVTVTGAGYAPSVVRPNAAEVRWMMATAKTLMAIKSIPWSRNHQSVTIEETRCTISFAADFGIKSE